MRSVIAFIIFALLLLMPPATAIADTVSVSGVVLTRTQDPIEDVEIRLFKNDNKKNPYITHTKDNGRFYIRDIPEGRYTLEGEVPSGAVFKSKITVNSRKRNDFRIYAPD